MLCLEYFVKLKEWKTHEKMPRALSMYKENAIWKVELFLGKGFKCSNKGPMDY